MEEGKEESMKEGRKKMKLRCLCKEFRYFEFAKTGEMFQMIGIISELPIFSISVFNQFMNL